MPGTARRLGIFWGNPGGTGPSLLHPWSLMPSWGEDTLTGAVSALWCCNPQGGWEYWNMAQGLGVAAGMTSEVDGGVVGGCWPCCSLMAPSCLSFCTGGCAVTGAPAQCPAVRAGVPQASIHHVQPDEEGQREGWGPEGEEEGEKGANVSS